MPIVAFAMMPMCQSAMAQAIKASEQPNFYASVRGWDVFSITDSEWGFQGCRAIKNGRSGMIMIGYTPIDRTANNGDWQLIVPTLHQGRYDGGIVSVDGYEYTGQFGFSQGWATKQLSEYELASIKDGDVLRVKINGDPVPSRSWELKGSTAASLKAYECTHKGGIAPNKVTQRSAPSTLPPVPKSDPKSPFLFSPDAGNLPAGSKIDYSSIGNCKFVFSQPFRCSFSFYVPDQQYKHTFLIEDTFNENPSLLVRIKSSSEIHVWETGMVPGNGLDPKDWKFLGDWEIGGSNGECLRPKDNQSSEAKRNLGQDSWELCLLM